jgi:hypothetical protein
MAGRNVSGVEDGEQKKTYRVIVRRGQSSNNAFGPRVLNQRELTILTKWE